MTKIVVTHLTRMHRGAVCVAGLETRTGRHVRPVLLERPLWLSDTAIRGGLFDMASEIDLGPTRPVGAAPHVENHEFQYAQARQLGTTQPQRFWDMLWNRRSRSLTELFGPKLSGRGYLSAATDKDCGRASLGIVQPTGTPELAITGREHRSAIRIYIQTSDFSCLDLAVTDLRLYSRGGSTPDRESVYEIGERLKLGVPILLSVGLTAAFQAVSSPVPLHWLQVNNIHLADNPCLQMIGSAAPAFRVNRSERSTAPARQIADDLEDLPF